MTRRTWPADAAACPAPSLRQFYSAGPGSRPAGPHTAGRRPPSGGHGGHRDGPAARSRCMPYPTVILVLFECRPGSRGHRYWQLIDFGPTRRADWDSESGGRPAERFGRGPPGSSHPFNQRQILVSKSLRFRFCVLAITGSTPGRGPLIDPGRALLTGRARRAF